MKKVIIAGSRDFTDYELVKKHFTLWFSGEEEADFTIISGGARGADRLGEQLAYEYGIELVVMPADWDKYGKSAGYRRNEQMAKKGTHLLAFWDGKSKGTQHMINLATAEGLEVTVVTY